MAGAKALAEAKIKASRNRYFIIMVVVIEEGDRRNSKTRKKWLRRSTYGHPTGVTP